MNTTIKSNSASAEIKSFGAELTSIKDGEGTQYLWQGDPAYWSGQSPVLFPIAGNLRGKKATAGSGKACHMERHGVVRKMEFSLLENTGDSATFSVHSNQETRQRFPYDFEFQVKYTICEKSLTMSFTATNRDSEPMPFFVGGHPAFNCPLFEGESFEDYVVEFEKKEYANCPRPTKDGLVDVEHRTLILNNSNTFPLDHTWFSYDCQIFDQLKSRSVKMYNPKTGRGMRVDFPDFEYLVVWSSKSGGNFVAIEPWTGISTCSDEDDALEHKRGVKILPPNASQTFSIMMTLL
ncbi:MAG: aldose 1-epimerase family protein [Clostridiales bacterium]|nr:aldose 1-epimerase family protein [Clostridiales bacterium]